MTISASAILEFLQSSSGRPFREREIAQGLGLGRADVGEIRDALVDLELKGLVYRVGKKRYAAAGKVDLVTGRFSATRSGAGFVIPDAGGPDIFIPESATGGAVDRDHVVARVERAPARTRHRHKRADRAQGTVISIGKRARRTVVGRVYTGPGRPFVRPMDPRLDFDVRVRDAKSAQPGDLAVVQVLDWGDGGKGVRGAIERVLGPMDKHGVDVLAIACSYELPVEFPPDVQQEAERLYKTAHTIADTGERTDMRDLLVFTIDPSDAKDHDDAVSIRELGDGRWEVGVHIADVAHFVRPGTLLDAEAMARGTSVYLVDRVVPMLPFALSGDLCSLQPGVDRLALSLLVELDEAGRRIGYHLQRTRIRSRHRLSYEHAQEVLDGEASIDEEADRALRDLDNVARVLRRQRVARGSLDFDLPEPHVLLDESGRPTDIQEAQRFESHRLIEDLMLLANEVVAEMLTDGLELCLYRVHERPDPARLEQARRLAATFGYQLPGAEQIRPRDLQQFLASVAERAEGALLHRVVLRSMKQARYSDINLGHFGLAATAYTHFTSPIRRYPDLVVHRLCRALLDGKAAPLEREKIAHIAVHTSEREQIAAQAERDSVDLKKVQLMREHLGETFEGTISRFTAFGFYVLLDEYHVEGLVHVASLEDDYYQFDEDTYTLIGERTGRIFRLAERVRVRVARASLEERQIDFQLTHGTGRSGSSGTGGRNRRGPRA